MKKKKKIIILVSSILCSFAFVGLFALGMFSNDHKQKVLETKADTSIMVNQGGIDFTIQSDKINNLSFRVYGDYTYNRTYLSGADGYSFTFSLSYDLIEDNNGVETIYPIYMDSAKTQTIQTFSTGLLNGYVNGAEVKEVTSLDLKLYLRYYDDLYNGAYRVYPVIWFYYGKLGGVDNNTPLYFSNRFDFGLSWYTDYYYQITDPDEYINHFLITTPANLGVINIGNDIDTYAEGYNDGYGNGYNSGYSDGLTIGTSQGYDEGYAVGYTAGSVYAEDLLDDYYQQGYVAGYDNGSSEDATVTSIFGGITTVALVPVKFFLSVFNFEILGVNIASVVSALMSICLILIVWRTVMGGKNND